MTFEHLDREMKRKKGVYNIKYMTIESQDTLMAMVYSIEGDKVTILDRKGFSFITASNCQLVDFQKDSHNKVKQVLNLFSISVDSLNSILKKNTIVSLSIQADEELYYFENVVMKKATSFDINFPKKDIVFFEGIKAQDNSDIEMKLLSIQEQEIENRYAYDIDVHNKKVQRYEELRQRHDTNAIAEGVRRRKEQEMKEELEEYIKPYKENTESYKLRRELLRRNMKKKNASLSASLVLWN